MSLDEGRTVMASARITDAVAAHGGLLSRRLVCMAMTLEALAAKKGRVVVYPSVRIVERAVPSSTVRVVTAEAVTAPRPGWRKPRMA